MTPQPNQSGIFLAMDRLPTLGLNPMLRQHHRVRKQEKEEWVWTIAGALRPRQRRRLMLEAARVKQLVRVRLKFYWPARRLDPDNLGAAGKNILDALKELRFIRNDSARWIEYAVDQDLARNNQRAGAKGPETHLWLEPVC